MDRRERMMHRHRLRRSGGDAGELLFQLVGSLFVAGYYAGKGIYNVARRPSGIKIPCATEAGAVQDYAYVVAAYPQFGGKNCFDKLPEEIRRLHYDLQTKVNQLVARNPNWGVSRGRLLTRPSSVWLPCQSVKSAFDDYNQVVLQYQSYSGPWCWSKLPDAFKQLHSEHVVRCRNLLQQAYAANKARLAAARAPPPAQRAPALGGGYFPRASPAYFPSTAGGVRSHYPVWPGPSFRPMHPIPYGSEPFIAARSLPGFPRAN